MLWLLKALFWPDENMLGGLQFLIGILIAALIITMLIKFWVFALIGAAIGVALFTAGSIFFSGIKR